MHKETKYFATFNMPGAFFGEQDTREVASLDPSLVAWPKNAYSFTLSEREDVVDGGTRYAGKAHQVGACYWHPDTVVESLEAVKRNPKANETLIANMECNSWSHIAWSRWDNWPQPFNRKTDVVLP